MNKSNSVLIYTQQFPLDENIKEGIFTFQIAKNMADQKDVIVVRPIPFNIISYLFKGFIKPKDYELTLGKVKVYYSYYPHIPYLFRIIQPVIQFASLKKRITKIVKKHNVSVINSHFLFPDGVASMFICKSLGIRSVLTALGSDVNVYPLKLYYRLQIKWALANANIITAVSRQLITKMVELGANKKSSFVINNGIDKSKFNYSNTLSEKYAKQLNIENQNNIVYVGRLHSIKRIDVLVKSLNLCSTEFKNNSVLHIIGDGPEKKKLKMLVDKENLQNRVVFHGNLTHEEIAKYMIASDLFCLVSKNEGQPNVILEALACGLPVVATNVGGIPDLIDSKNGVLVEPDNPADLALAMMNVFKLNLDRNSIHNNSSILTWDEVASNYLSAYSTDEKK